MKVLNWNAEANKLYLRTAKFERSRELVARHDADVICLTEAFPDLMPDEGETVTSDLSGWPGRHEERGARKVVLWSRSGWTDVDGRGSQQLPEGRFVCATTTFAGTDVTVVGMCIPYREYRTSESWGTRRRGSWEGACEYLDALRRDVLTQPRFRQRTILLGDFNLEIPPKGYPRRQSVVNRKREAAFSGWTLPTAGVWDDSALDKRFKDPVGLSPDVRAGPPRFFSRFDGRESALSDHNGVCIEIEMP